MTATTDPLLATRPEFPILERSTYLAAHTLGPVPRAGIEALAAYGRQWAERGVRAWSEGWWALPERAGDAVARLLGAPAGTVATPPHATAAMAGLLSSLDFAPPRDRVLTTSVEFPSVLQQVLAWEAYGARPEVVPSEDGLEPPVDELLARIDERVRLVSVCHVYFRHARLVDVRRIVERAHAAGALVALDTYQSLGTVPVDVAALGVDFALGGSVKWVLGGPGVGYLYARPGLLETLEPRVRGWSGHADPFGFEPAWAPAAGARRFETGTPNAPALAGALPGYELVASLGVDRIRAKSLRQTRLLIELADAAGLRVVSPRADDERGGSVVLDVSPIAGEGVGHAVAAALNARDVVLDYRPGAGIRLAPHFYTRDDELETAVGELVNVVETGAHGTFRQRGRVT